jgi:hypothetical protein
MEALERAKFSSKEIISKAKLWIADQYMDESINDIGLEEVRFENGIWHITIGFQRKRVIQRVTVIDATMFPESSKYEKALKVVSISDSTGEILSMRDRLTD